MLAHEHGYMPENPTQEYEVEWLYSTYVDIMEKDRYASYVGAFKEDDATEEMKQSAITLLGTFIRKCDAQWADGRAHISGDKLTHADF